jgi:LacI family transcriptional regulator
LSRQTIGRALNELAMEGVLMRIRGSGTYVAEKKPLNRPMRIMICDIHLKGEGEYNGPIFAGIRKAAGEEKLDVNYYHDAMIPKPEEISGPETDGVLIQSPNIEDIPTLLQLRETGKPIVAMALRSRFGSLTSVCTDNMNGMKQAVRYLIDQGHRRIAFASQGLTSSDVQERLAGFHQAFFEAGLPVDPSYLLVFDKLFGMPVLESWFDTLQPRPTAILCSVSLIFPLQQILWSRHLQIPKDVSMIVTDDSHLFQNCVPKLTAISQPLFEMGYRSLNKLVRMLRGEDKGQPEVLPMEFIIRDSVAPPGKEI